MTNSRDNILSIIMSYMTYDLWHMTLLNDTLVIMHNHTYHFMFYIIVLCDLLVIVYCHNVNKFWLAVCITWITVIGCWYHKNYSDWLLLHDVLNIKYLMCYHFGLNLKPMCVYLKIFLKISEQWSKTNSAQRLMVFKTLIFVNCKAKKIY